jgi:hypothetical protein
VVEFGTDIRREGEPFDHVDLLFICLLLRTELNNSETLNLLIEKPVSLLNPSLHKFSKNMTKKKFHLIKYIQKQIYIQLHPNNINRKEGLHLSSAWKSLIHKIKDKRLSPDSDTLEEKQDKRNT